MNLQNVAKHGAQEQFRHLRAVHKHKGGGPQACDREGHPAHRSEVEVLTDGRLQGRGHHGTD